MPDFDGTAEQITGSIHALVIARTTPEQRHQAARTICDLAGNRDDAITPLQALGLLPDESADRAPFQGVDRYVHGSRSSVERHRTEHTALCAPCQRWVQVNDRRQHRTRG
jgi:hypothetical protein